MVRFFGLCVGKIRVRKTKFFLVFFVERFSFFCQNHGACFLIANN